MATKCGLCGRSHHTFYNPKGRAKVEGEWSKKQTLDFPVCFKCYLKGAYNKGSKVYKWDIVRVMKTSKSAKCAKVPKSYQKQYGKAPSAVYLQKV